MRILTSLYEFDSVAVCVAHPQGYILPTGWEVFTTSDDIWDIDGSCSKDGFYAIAYMNHNYQVRIFD